MDQQPEIRDRPRRRGREDRRGAHEANATPKPQPRLPFQPVAVVSADELEAIHEASLKILEEIGMDVLHAEAKEVLKRAGADVDPNSDRVRFDRGLIESKIGLAPKEFTLHSRNPARNLKIGGNNVAFLLGRVGSKFGRSCRWPPPR